MNTTYEPREAKHDSAGNAKTPVSSNNLAWAQTAVVLGTAVWAAMAVLARVGIARVGEIELLFLFAPLVIVPLGIELTRTVGGTGKALDIASRLQPFGAIFAVWSMCLAPGRKAGFIATGWLLICLLIAIDGGKELLSMYRARENLFPLSASICVRIVMSIARIDLSVGGAWLVASRLGTRPMGIQEPIGLLTAVHFHFAGFATAIIAAITLRFRELRLRGKNNRWLQRLTIAIAVLPYLIAIGFVTSGTLKMTAAVLFSACVAVLAIFLRSCGKRAEDAAARFLLQISAGSIFAGMIFSMAYAIVDFLGSDALTIPEMAKTHGLLNAFGFCLAGLLGWLVETAHSQPTSERISGQIVR